MSASTPTRTRALQRVTVIAVASAILFFLYWRLSMTQPVNSDNATNALESWSMLHGNWLLHGWWLTDVSFYTTELPQYVLVEIVAGLGPWVVHVAAAMTYTLLVLAVGLAAKGRATGREGLVRALLAAGIVLAPQISGAAILLLGPDHTGTVVPVLLTLVVIDRFAPVPRASVSAPGAPEARFREWWFVPPVVCVLLTWIMIADSVVLLTAIVPLVVVAGARAVHGLLRRTRQPAARWYELSVAGAGVVAAGLGTLAPRVITAMGGYQVWPYTTQTEPLSKLPHGAWITLQAVLELFGADISSAQSPAERVFVALHLVGVLLAVCGLGIALTRFFRAGELLVAVVAVAILLELGAFPISVHATTLGSIREIVAVMPFGAVLAGRTLAGAVIRVRLAVPALTVVAAGYLAALGFGAAQPPAPAAQQGLATWLAAHDLNDGLATYWEAGSTTLDSGGRVLVSGVIAEGGKLGVYNWSTDDSEYDPATHDATFALAGGPSSVRGTQAAAERTFGPPLRVYHAYGFTIMVWGENLLRYLPR